ncbi:MAG: ABC transporter permease [Actinobacteria bacterium]|nr:ABC transporter permease [Actinomycetota bacterium]
MAQVRPLVLASAKMFYRSLDTVWFAVASPFILLAILALVRHLRFGLPGGAGAVGFLTFTALGYAAFLGAHFHQDGVVGTASGYRAEGVLKRIAATPISASAFIAAQVMVRLVVALLQTVAFLAAAVAVGASVTYTADLLWIFPVIATAVLTGTAFGFAIAGVAGNPEAANQLNIALFTPVILLAGVQYPLQGLPGPLPEIAPYAVPFAAPIEAFRQAVAGDLGGDFPRLLLLSLAWLGIALALAVRSYRLVEDGA